MDVQGCSLACCLKYESIVNAPDVHGEASWGQLRAGCRAVCGTSKVPGSDVNGVSRHSSK